MRGLESKVRVRRSDSRHTFTIGVVVPQRAEAILAHAAVPGLQVHAVGVLRAAVAFRAEVMTCRRHAGKGRHPEGRRREGRRREGNIELYKTQIFKGEDIWAIF